MLPFLALGLLLLCCRHSWGTAFTEETEAGETTESTDAIPKISAKEAGVFVMVCAAGLLLFAISYAANKRTLSKLSERTLSMSGLNKAVIFKEVFLSYVSAIVLEPVINIVSNPEMQVKSLIVNLLMILAIMWWVYILNDAFDCNDVTQDKKYSKWRDVKRDYDWFKLHEGPNVSTAKFMTSICYDIGLWFSLMCIASAFCFEEITHREVFHAWAMVLLWCIQHSLLQMATAWGAGFFVSFFVPSVSLMPIELCLPLQDVQDTIDSLEDVKEWRDFIERRVQVRLQIVP